MKTNQELIHFLNQELSNLNMMYVKLHRYHWFVQGKHFFTLHKLFEDLYNEIAEDLDVIAERVLAINGLPLATMAKYLDEATLEEAEAESNETEMLTHLQNDYLQLINEIKETGLKLAEEVHDEPTADLLIGLQGKLEKHTWMLRATLAYE